MTEPLDWAVVPYATLRHDLGVRRNLERWVVAQQDAGRAVRRRLTGSDVRFEAFARPERSLSIDLTARADIDTQLLALSRSTASRPWRPSSVREALGVPSIFRAASLIANTTGSLSMRALRNEVEMPPQDRPSLIVRPDPTPGRTPRAFYRDTAWNLARYGEAWWYVARRDGDGVASALYNILDVTEVQVEADPDDPLRPRIAWRGRSTAEGTLRHEDMRQLTFLPDDTGLRGMGPLQVCGAAVSVAVESQEWAANFFAAGGYPNLWIKAAGVLGGGEDEAILDEDADQYGYSEAERLKAQWVSTAPNTPKVTDESILDIKQFDPNPQGAAMLDARDHQNGDAARMFGIPGSLLDYRAPGSNLTYQNIEGEFTKWLRAGLRIGYLEPIEQAMSDLLTRTTVARFNTEQLEAPDVKTRFEVYQLATAVLGPDEGAEYARKREGLAPGNVENAPVPLLPPASVPRALDRDVRCPRCRKLVARALGPGSEVECRGCKTLVRGPDAAEPTVTKPTIEVHAHFPERMVQVDAPVTIHPADVHVEPTFVAPAPAPLEFELTLPDTEKRVAALGEEVAAFSERVGGLIEAQAGTHADTQAALAALADTNREVAAQLAQTSRPRKVTPVRDPVTQQIIGMTTEVA